MKTYRLVSYKSFVNVSFKSKVYILLQLKIILCTFGDKKVNKHFWQLGKMNSPHFPKCIFFPVNYLLKLMLTSLSDEH